MKHVSSALLALGSLWTLILGVGLIKLFTDNAGDACGVSSVAGLTAAILMALTAAACLVGGVLLMREGPVTTAKHEIGAVNCGCGWHPSCVGKEPRWTLASSDEEPPVDDERDFGPGLACKHCGRTIAAGNPKSGWVHALDSGHNGKSRCEPDEGRRYGYNAEPEGQPCQPPCIGTRYGRQVTGDE